MNEQKPVITNTKNLNEIYEAGVYHVEIHECKIMATKRKQLGINQSENLLITFKPFNGPASKDIVEALSIANINQESQRVAWLKLSIISKVCGVVLDTDPENIEKMMNELLNKKLILVVQNKMDKFNNLRSTFFYERYEENNQ